MYVYTYTYIYMAINNSQIMEEAQMSINCWTDKEDVVFIYNGILVSHQKEWILAICNSVDGTREYYAKQNKSVKEKYHMVLLICRI